MAAPANYVRVFGDDFLGSNLDTTKWWTRLIENGGEAQQTPSNGDQQLFTEGQDGQPTHVMTGSSVKLMWYSPKASDPSFSAGMIRSKTVFDLQNGPGFYFESRLRINGGNGVHPAFWITREARADGSAPWPPEIDIAEFSLTGLDGGELNQVHTGIQTNGVPWADPGYQGPWDAYLPFRASYTNNDNANFNPGSWWTAPFANWSIADYHTYGLLYEPGAAGQPHVFTTMIDGRMILTGTYDWMGADSQPIMAHCLINTEIGDNMGTANGQVPVDLSKMPGWVEVDYVHVFEKQYVSQWGSDHMPTGG